MSLPRFFCMPCAQAFKENEIASFELEPSDFHHIVHVMRIARGEEIELVVRDTWAGYRVKVMDFEEPVVTVQIIEGLASGQPTHEVALFFGLSKGDKNDTIVRQAVEIGAHALYPVLFERSVVKLDAKKIETRSQRLVKIAKSAAQQSHRPFIPTVKNIAALSKDCTREALTSYDHLYVLWEEAQGATLLDAVRSDLIASKAADSFACIVGPEGGITREEVEFLKSCGAQSVTLGSTILRVDTANAVTLGVVCALLGEAHEC